jgi:hypothetical protein
VLLDINTPPDVNAPFGFPRNPLPTTKEASSSSSFAPIPFEEETRGKNRLLVVLLFALVVKFPRCKSRALLFSAVAIVASMYSFCFLSRCVVQFQIFSPTRVVL